MSPQAKLSKGELTAQRIIDAAEQLFAQQGYQGTSLRQIAAAAGLHEPGLYNHFASKQALYEAVLARGLQPLAAVLQAQLARTDADKAYTDIPGEVLSVLAAHPPMANLLQQALQADDHSPGQQMLTEWLARLVGMGSQMAREAGADPEDAVLYVMAMFNVAIGYFLARPAFVRLVGPEGEDATSLARQQRLLQRMAKGLLSPKY